MTIVKLEGTHFKANPKMATLNILRYHLTYLYVHKRTTTYTYLFKIFKNMHGFFFLETSSHFVAQVTVQWC